MVHLRYSVRNYFAGKPGPVTAWTSQMAAFAKSIDSNHLVRCTTATNVVCQSFRSIAYKFCECG